HVLRLDGALRGEEVARYPGGPSQRDSDIAKGAARSARELIDDVTSSAERLEGVWARSEQAGWPHADILATDHWRTTASPVRRLREVEVHHVDLGLGYEPTDWPDDYVRWELAETLERLPQRISGAGDTQRLLAWLIGRTAPPPAIELDPWP
ncbi:MAG: maleylpyruvate isomerase N-terminal domain-containing protein, partial [Nocardioidaceae bacterium]